MITGIAETFNETDILEQYYQLVVELSNELDEIGHCC